MSSSAAAHLFNESQPSKLKKLSATNNNNNNNNNTTNSHDKTFCIFLDSLPVIPLHSFSYGNNINNNNNNNNGNRRKATSDNDDINSNTEFSTYTSNTTNSFTSETHRQQQNIPIDSRNYALTSLFMKLSLVKYANQLTSFYNPIRFSILDSFNGNNRFNHKNTILSDYCHYVLNLSLPTLNKCYLLLSRHYLYTHQSVPSHIGLISSSPNLLSLTKSSSNLSTSYLLSSPLPLPAAALLQQHPQLKPVTTATAATSTAATISAMTNIAEDGMITPRVDDKTTNKLTTSTTTAAALNINSNNNMNTMTDATVNKSRTLVNTTLIAGSAMSAHTTTATTTSASANTSTSGVNNSNYATNSPESLNNFIKSKQGKALQTR